MPQTLDSTTGPTSSQQNGGSRSILREQKEELARSSHTDAPGEGGLHYGRKFAETVERFQAKHAEKEAEHGEGSDTPERSEAAAQGGAETADRNSQEERRTDRPSGEAREVSEPSLVAEVVTNAWSKIAAFTKATGAFAHSGWDLMMLPRETLTIAARRLLKTRTS